MRTVKEYKDLLWDKGRDKAMLYLPLEHPEFADWEVHQPCEERWDMISKSIGTRPRRTCVDLGCHTGWFCREFSRYEWIALGIDKNPLAIEVAGELMRPWDGKPSPKYQLGDLHEVDIPYGDIALCLSLVMYLFPEGDPDQGWDVLRRVSVSAATMFLDCGGRYQHRAPFSPEDAGPAILERTWYSSFCLLGTTALDRPLYRFDI